MDIKDLIKSQLYTKNGNINSAKIRPDRFNGTDLCNSICTLTNFLPDETSISERIYCILNDINSVQKCPFCEQPLLFSAAKNKGYYSTCSKNKCKRLYKPNWKSPASGQLSSYKEIKNNLNRIWTNNEYVLQSMDVVKAFIQQRILETDSGIKHSLTDIWHIRNKIDILCSLMFYTKEIIPVNLGTPMWSERMYILFYDIAQKPKCVICKKNETTYCNFKFGYRHCCSVECTNTLGSQNRVESHLQNILPVIEEQGFIPLNLQDYQGLNAGTIKLECKKCKNTIDRSLSSGRWQDIYCPGCYGDAGTSKGQQQVYEYIKSIYSGNILQKYKPFNSKHKQKEIDIYLPDKGLGIEYNGVFWHSYGITKGIGNNLYKEDKNKHVLKTNLCEKLNIQLLTIFESEWCYKRDIWQSIIASKLGIYQKYFARKCNIDLVSQEVANNFLTTNHLQGIADSDINLGLYHQNELVFIMSFKQLDHTNWELNRFCNKLTTSVLGGASKLFSYFIQKYKPESIISRANRRYSNGRIYQKLGFTLQQHTQPSCFYIKGINLYDYPQIEKDNTLIFNDGYRRIWDCGNIIFMWLSAK